jgi:RNA polymerase sigma-70 factor (ECF subfamily)
MIAARWMLRTGVSPVVGERLPFEEVYRQHAGAVYRFCLSQAGDPTVAEDLAADAFTSAFAAYPRMTGEATEVRPWLFRIARNAAIDHHRRQRRGLRRMLPLLPGARSRDNVEETVALRDELRRVVRAIGTVSERDRLLVGMRVAGRLRYAEIGRAMGISERAAKVATQRAVVRVRRQLEEQQ